MLHLEPIFKKSFISTTYSCIKKRGIHKCLRDLRKGLKNVSETTYALKMDIKQFYPSIDHTILKAFLRRKIKDKDLLGLLDSIIDSSSGVPLGNFSSQWFANLYLNKFDHWLKEKKRIKYYYRYCDDFVILGNDKDTLHKLRRDIEQYLGEFLKLKLSNYQVYPVASRGINFVGYVSYHTHTLLRKSIKQAFRTMLCNRPNSQSINSYLGWTKHANCRNLERRLLNEYKSIRY